VLALAAACVVHAETTADDGGLDAWVPAPATLAVEGTTGAEGLCAGEPDAETVLAEQRGPFQLLLRVDPTRVTTCLVAGDAVAARIDGPPAPTAGQAGASVLGYAGTAVGGGDVTVAYGLATGDVDAVVIARPDGVHVEATVTDGWWAAWWPGAPDDDAVFRVLGAEPVSVPLAHAYRRSQAQ
jgi:hypothetical protein